MDLFQSGEHKELHTVFAGEVYVQALEVAKAHSIYL